LPSCKITWNRNKTVNKSDNKERFRDVLRNTHVIQCVTHLRTVNKSDTQTVTIQDFEIEKRLQANATP
ncbi:MAG: hypothetical protein ACXWME_12855, partial [Syntrophales bacterium]